jgi:assimilatory nitrate reductase catalytic subunit
MLGEPVTEDAERRGLLAGRASDGIADHGPIICACFAIGRNRIAQAVAADGCHSVEAIGGALRAGTNCGSCIPELRRIIASETPRHAA